MPQSTRNILRIYDNNLQFFLVFLDDVWFKIDHNCVQCIKTWAVFQAAHNVQIAAIPKDDRLPNLRRLSEIFYGGIQSLKFSLNKSQTFNTVWISEGKV